MSRLGKSIVVTLSVIVFCYAGLGYLLGKSDDDKTYRSLTVYGEVLQHIQEDYVDEPNLPLVTAGSLQRLARIARSPFRLSEPARISGLSRSH